MATRPIASLLNSLALDRRAALSLQDQIFAFYRDGVLTGRMRAGSCVASSRVLAREHHIARITAVQAYDRLAAEGYLIARQGVGLFVAETMPDDSLRPAADSRVRRGAVRHRARAAGTLRIPPRPQAILPLSAGIPALDHFPWAEWARLTARVLRDRSADLLNYGDARGVLGLREAIAHYLGVARGIVCEPGQVFVVAGSQQGIDLTARALTVPGEAVWVEEPGYPIGRAAFQAGGLRLVPVPVDDHGLDVAAGLRLAPRARLVLVAPSHHYPLGVTMSLRRRRALLDWAESADAWIIEDDYDGEFRYAGRPLEALYSLDRNDRVFYLGTFSKILAPGMRLGYLVVPPDLVARVSAFKAAMDRQAQGPMQAVLAQFIAGGRMAAHLRRMRLLYAARRRALLDGLDRCAADVLQVHNNSEAGLHLVARLTVPADDVAASAAALAAGVHAAPLSSFYARAPRHAQGFVLGFAGTTAAQMEPALAKLVAAIRAGAPQKSRVGTSPARRETRSQLQRQPIATKGTHPRSG